MRLKGPTVHLLLLACILLEIVGVELVETSWLHHALDGLVVLTFGVLAREYCKNRWVGALILLLGAIPWAMDVAELSFEPLELESVFWGLTHLALAASVGWRLFQTPRIGFKEICDAVSIFLLIGLGFAAAYSVILGYSPLALRHVGGEPGQPIPYGLILYYSFITQLTVGYGDTVPAANSTRFVSILQALFGVMYVAILMARFVSLHSSSHRTQP